MDSPKGFEVPNHTQTPNSFFDVTMPKIKSATELKVVLAVIRQTFGWRKDEDQISLTRLQKLTGLTRESVSIGLSAALEHGHIKRSKYRNSFRYRLVLVGTSDQSDFPTSQEFRPETVGTSDQKVVGKSDPQKKGFKERKETVSAHSVLMKYHADKIGKILDGGKQAKAISRILAAGYSVEDSIAAYEWVSSWSDAPDWSLVQGKIGPWMAKRKSSGNSETRRDPDQVERRNQELERAYYRGNRT